MKALNENEILQKAIIKLPKRLTAHAFDRVGYRFRL